MHRPVMMRETIDLLRVQPGGTCVDGTLGGGGHAEEILRQLGPHGKLLGIDRDLEAVERARVKFSGWEKQCRLVHGNYGDMEQIAAGAGISSADGVLLDLGLSSDQIACAERGFSFMADGPLDMRMTRETGQPVSEMVNRLSERELADLIFEKGEEPAARRIARYIVARRGQSPILTTLQLADVVSRAVGGRRGRIHPATKTFQALRMAVNKELEYLVKGLEEGLALLSPGGRMAVITFHSGEDRVVKRVFLEHVGRWESLQQGGRRWIGKTPVVSLVNRKPLVPSEEELKVNPSARSAKLRVVERHTG